MVKRKRGARDGEDGGDGTDGHHRKHLKAALDDTIGTARRTRHRPSMNCPSDTGVSVEETAVVPKRASLLGIPAELRNRIYYDLFGSDDSVTTLQINKHNHLQPGLLRTSQQLRQETIKIWYHKRQFELQVYDMEVPQGGHWVWHAQTHGLEPQIMGMCRRESWPNLLQWVRLYHAGVAEAPQSMEKKRRDGMWDTIRGLFAVADV